MNWFTKVLSSEFEASSKRLAFLMLIVVQIISHFLIMYIKIQIANKELVEQALDNMFWLALVFGGYIAAEPLLKRAQIGGAKTVVNQDVQEQTVINEPEQTLTTTTTTSKKGKR
jgi:hypothetical protein